MLLIISCICLGFLIGRAKMEIASHQELYRHKPPKRTPVHVPRTPVPVPWSFIYSIVGGVVGVLAALALGQVLPVKVETNQIDVIQAPFLSGSQEGATYFWSNSADYYYTNFYSADGGESEKYEVLTASYLVYTEEQGEPYFVFKDVKFEEGWMNAVGLLPNEKYPTELHIQEKDAIILLLDEDTEFLVDEDIEFLILTN